MARVVVALMAILGGALLVGPAWADGQPEVSRPSEDSFANSIGMKFKLIPAGSFWMGSTDSELERMKEDFKRATGKEFKLEWQQFIDWEKPRHRVRLSRGFFLGVHEVTVGQFKRFVEETGHRTTAEKQRYGLVLKGEIFGHRRGAKWRDPFGDGRGVGDKEEHPVTQVSLGDAHEFIKWLNRKEGVAGYRLPMEAEWEYACRGGREGELYPWGHDMPPRRRVANLCDESSRRKFNWIYYIQGYDDGYPETSPVGSFEANGFGLYDMVGNVWEWCEDRFDENYYPNSPEIDPTGPSSGMRRVLRGGSWIMNPFLSRSALRGWLTPGVRSNDLGFRLARTK